MKIKYAKKARKNLERVPKHIVENFRVWGKLVREQGIEAVRQIPGYHDEPLPGRREGERSVRLSRAYRLLYRIEEGEGRVLLVLDVNKHNYQEGRLVEKDEEWVEEEEMEAFLDRLVGPVTLGMVLRSSRVRLDLTQKEMAKRLGLQVSHLSAIERDKRFVSVEKAKGFAGPLGLPEPYLASAVIQDQLRRAGFSRVEVRHDGEAFLVRVA